MEEALPLDLHYLLRGASAAAVIARLMGQFGFYALFIAVRSLRSCSSPINLPEEYRSLRKQAEQAERHVEELPTS